MVEMRALFIKRENVVTGDAGITFAVNQPPLGERICPRVSEIMEDLRVEGE
jgi:hypothetical protein